MSWLSGLLGLLVKPVLDWIFEKITAWEKARQKQQEIDERTKREAEAVKNAETEDELEKAAKDILNRK